MCCTYKFIEPDRFIMVFFNELAIYKNIMHIASSKLSVTLQQLNFHFYIGLFFLFSAFIHIDNESSSINYYSWPSYAATNPITINVKSNQYSCRIQQYSIYIQSINPWTYETTSTSSKE